MIPEKDKATEVFEAAEKKMRVGCGGGARFEEAAELYTKAGNLYKMDKRWERAAESFLEAAECYARSSDFTFDTVQQYSNAIGCIKKYDPLQAISFYKKSVDLLIPEGKFSSAARLTKEMAEILETSGSSVEAIAAWERAAELFETENSPSSLNQCLIKVADISVREGEYKKAIEIYEKVAESSLNGLAKYNVKNYLHKATLCFFANNNSDGAMSAFRKYTEMDPLFASSREAKLIEEIFKVWEDADPAAFSAAVYEYDAIMKLNRDMVVLLLKIKENITSRQIV